MPENIKELKAIYNERQERYCQLCDALVAAQEAVNSIREMVETAQGQMNETGQELLRAMGRLSE